MSFYSKKFAVFRPAEPPKIVGLAGATTDSLRRLSGSSLDEGQDIRNLHLPEVAAAPSNFVPDLPRIAECRSPRSETVRLSSFSLFYDGRSRMALTRYRNCFRDPRLCAACLTNWSIPNRERFFLLQEKVSVNLNMIYHVLSKRIKFSILWNNVKTAKTVLFKFCWIIYIKCEMNVLYGYKISSIWSLNSGLKTDASRLLKNSLTSGLKKLSENLRLKSSFFSSNLFAYLTHRYFYIHGHTVIAEQLKNSGRNGTKRDESSMRIDNEFPRNADFNINCQTFYFDGFLWPIPSSSFWMLPRSPLPPLLHFFDTSPFLTSWKNVSQRALSLFPGSDARFIDTFFSERTYPTVPGIDGPFSKVCLPSTSSSPTPSFGSFLSPLSRGAAETLTKFFLRRNMKHPYE